MSRIRSHDAVHRPSPDPISPSTVESAYALSYDHVTLRFGDRTVLDDFCLHVPAGAHVVLMGASGSGKTSILRLAAGLQKPTSGSVLVGGQIAFSGKRNPCRVAVQFQEPCLLPWLTAAENINVVLSDSKKTLPEGQNLLELVGLAQAADLYPAQLSGGMAQRVALCRALAAPSDLLLLDEPFRGLDAGTKEQIIDLVRRLTEGKTLVLVTHSEAEARQFSDAPVCLRGNTVQKEETCQG